jgi:hypothetical protein
MSLTRLAEEPPFRLLTKFALRYLPVSLQTRARWDLSPRPAYTLGVLTAALKARHQGVPEISVIEFGVAAGSGLLTLERESAAIEAQTGVQIRVYGFDSGRGLPFTTGDYRDHPDYWQHGDFPMDEAALRSKLSPKTQLILGDVRETVPHFITHTQKAPLGFVSFDLDLYSSTIAALQVFSHPQKRMLLQVPCYFDDIEYFVAHKFAGELLAIDDFNAQQRQTKIDRWYDIARQRPFPEASYLRRMYVAHDLEAINATVTRRPVQHATGRV